MALPEDALTTVDSVLALLEETVTEQMKVNIESGIAIASDLARYHGREWSSITACPVPIQRIVAMAVARWIRNPDGFQQNRAGDETLGWFEGAGDPGEIYFTERDIARIERIANPQMSGFGTIQMVAYGELAPRQDVYIPVASGGADMPWTAADGKIVVMP